MPPIRSGTHVGAHRDVRRDRIEAGLVVSASDVGVLPYQLAVAVGPLGSHVVDPIVVVSVLGDRVYQALSQCITSRIVLSQRLQ